MANLLSKWIRRAVSGDIEKRDRSRAVRRDALDAVEQKKLELGRALKELAEARQKTGSAP